MMSRIFTMVPPQRWQYCTGAGRFSIGTIAGAYRKDHLTGRSHVFTRSTMRARFEHGQSIDEQPSVAFERFCVGHAEQPARVQGAARAILILLNLDRCFCDNSSQYQKREGRVVWMHRLSGHVRMNADCRYPAPPLFGLAVLFGAPAAPALRRLADQMERSVTPLVNALLEVYSILGHLVGDMREADDVLMLCGRQRVEGRRLHLHGQDALRPAACKHGFGFPKRRVCGPARAGVQRYTRVIPPGPNHLANLWAQLAIGRRRQVVVAGALIAKCALDEHEVGRRTDRGDLA